MNEANVGLGAAARGRGQGVAYQNDRRSASQLTEAWCLHAPELLRRCVAWMGGNRAEGEDAYGRLAIQASVKFPRYRREIINLRAWLLRLAYNCCMDLYRQRKRLREERLIEGWEQEEVNVDPTFASLRGDPEARYLERELVEHLQGYIDELPVSLREPLRRRIEQETYRSISEALSITQANARKRVQKARERLRTRLELYRQARRSDFHQGVRPIGQR